MSNEIWKDISGYEGLYQVSDLGRVKSLRRSIVMSPRKDRKGYKIILLCNGTQKSFKVHRLVAQAFIPNPSNKPEVNHIDGNKSNNCIDNLEWCTGQENMRHAIKHGLWTPNGNLLNPLGKPVAKISKDYKLIAAFQSPRTAKRILNVSDSHIYNMCNGIYNPKRAKHIWRYLQPLMLPEHAT